MYVDTVESAECLLHSRHLWYAIRWDPHSSVNGGVNGYTPASTMWYFLGTFILYINVQGCSGMRVVRVK